MPRDGVPSTGVPKRSTPSRAAVMSADPNVAGSKRPGRFEALRVLPCDREPIPAPILVAAPPLLMASGVKNAEYCGRVSFVGDARCAWKSSTK